MTARLVMLFATLSGSAIPALAQDSQRPVLLAPNPELFPSTQVRSAAMLIDYVPGAVRCGNELVEPVALEAPFPAMVLGNAGRAEQLPVTFRIDADGRPLSIGRVPSRGPIIPSDGPASDISAALAASRFPAGQARPDCRITYEARPIALESAPPALVQRYMVAPHRRLVANGEIFRRIHPSDTTCLTQQVRMRAYPDFDAIPQRSGTWSYAMAGFDIDGGGKPANVRIVSSEGNAALDRATVQAVRQSRFVPKARTGCTYPYYRRSAEPLKAPVMPARESFRPENANCPAELRGKMTPPETASFPQAFHYRRIEGWAAIAFDVAPWGERGNIRVLASEPAAAFGDLARGIVMRAPRTSSETGGTGCVEIVRFVMPADTSDNDERDQD